MEPIVRDSGLNELPDSVLKREYPTLKDECYLDHAGAALYSCSQIDNVATDLKSSLYSNPHSSSISSKHCTDTIDQVRYRILEHFNTDINEYSVIFTSGATASLKLVAETFDFFGTSEKIQTSVPGCGTGGTFAYLQDNHTSVLGMREIILERGAQLLCVKHEEAFQLMNVDEEHYVNGYGEHGHNKPKQNSLFVYPGQCNFSGLKYPLGWIKKCHEGIFNRYYGNKNSALRRDENWYCLLDAASLVSTSSLDLSKVKPDFLCVSFYKIFGFPTGLGALIVRNDTGATLLKKSYYGGGTVLIALSSTPFHVKRPQLHERFEDGTLNFLSVVSLLHGLEALKRLGINMETISLHCHSVARYLHSKLLMLHHVNGMRAVVLYCDTDFSDVSTQGNIVNFNIVRDNGDYVGYAEVQALANLNGIHIRSGCFCNPGACQRHLQLTDDQLIHHFREGGHVCGDNVDLVNGQPTGSLRVSFGLYSRLADVDRLISFIEHCFVSKPPIYKVPDDWEEHSKKMMAKFTRNCNNCINGKTVAADNKLKQKSPTLVCNMKNGVETFSDFNSIHALPSQVNGVVLDDVDNDNNIVEKIYVYPIKSCGALEISTKRDQGGWPIDSRGFKYDRQWMVTNSNGVALTQKTQPNLCLIKPFISNDYQHLILTAPGENDCIVPINIAATDVLSLNMCQSKVCGDRVLAVDCGDEVGIWLSKVLNLNGIRLVKQSIVDGRVTQKSKYKSLNGEIGVEVTSPLLSLSNKAQFLLINMATVNWLAEQLPPEWTLSNDKDNLLLRFRSNFVVGGGLVEPFEEQKWTKVKIGEISFKVVGPCSRCQMICIDQTTGVRTKEPLTTLSASLSGKMQFGIYLEQIIQSTSLTDDDRQQIINIGDKVTVEP